MIFGESQEVSAAAAHRRRSMATTSAVTDYEADLSSKDRMKQKDAIKRMIAGKVKVDWEWNWPREEGTPATPIVNLSRENLHDYAWTERDEWTSDPSEDEDENGATIVGNILAQDPNSKDPFRFDSPDGVGETLRRTVVDRKARRRRRLQEEMRINDGLSCFTHRRNAWTGARHVRWPSKVPSTPPSTNGTRSRSLSKTLSYTSSHLTRSQSSLTSSSFPGLSDDEDWVDLITEIPIAQPILPPETPMRKGINDRAYATIYDKVVLQSQTPFCPINLGIITKSCVEGWKRDGEWPRKSAEIGNVIASVSKMGIGSADLGNMGRGGDGKGKGNANANNNANANGNGIVSGNGKGVIRRSLQKVMGAVRERAGSKGKEGEVLVGNLL